MTADAGYVNYFEILEIPEDAKPGDAHKAYRRKIKDLHAEIARTEITEHRRAHFLLEMAKLNAAIFVLRDNARREEYWAERQRLIKLEREWKECAAKGLDTDRYRREFERRIRDFLARFVEEAMLDAGRDKECVEISRWDRAHERHASRILRRYRQLLYRQVLERLPYFDVTPPEINWDERRKTIAAILRQPVG